MFSSKKKNKETRVSNDEEEKEGSLVKKPWVRRRVVLHGEPTIYQNQPLDFVPFQLVDKPKNVPLDIFEDEEDAGPTLNPPSSHTERLFTQGLEGEEDNFDFILEKPPLATLPMTPAAPTVTHSVTSAATPTATPVAVPHGEAGPSSGRGMKQVLIEFPEGTNLLNKSN